MCLITLLPWQRACRESANTRCFCSLLCPVLTLRVRRSMRLLTYGSCLSWGAQPFVLLQAVSELLKLLLVVMSGAARLGPAVEDRTMALFVPLLIAAVAPVDGQAHPSTASLALQMVQRLATGPASTAFRSAVAGLAADSKDRLQSALRKGMQGSKPQEAPVASKHKPSANLPSIQLRSFALPQSNT